MSFPELPFTPDQPWLAPLAGYTDLPFRLLCREHGAAAACTEMISAKGLVYQSSGTTRLVKTCPADRPLVVQLFGSEPGYLREALRMLMDMGHVFFDLNAGCPVKKVVKTGAGGALLQDPQSLADLVQELAGVAGQGRLGVKIRSGWDRHTARPGDLARKLEASGAAWITLHPRTARQGFSGRADWSALKEVREQVALPVLGSGDLFTAADALSCLNQTGISGVMFARGALNNPAVFEQLRRLLQGGADLDQGGSRPEYEKDIRSGEISSLLQTTDGRRDAQGLELVNSQAVSPMAGIARRHIELCQEYEHGPRAFLRMRTVLPRYFRGFTGAKALRLRIVGCRSWEELLDFVSGLADCIEFQTGEM